MTALLTSGPTALAAYAVDGPSALVPGTALRLPVLPVVAHLPIERRCDGCAGTGVEFFEGTLYSCGCMELPVPSAPAQHGPALTAQGMTWVAAEGRSHIAEALV